MSADIGTSLKRLLAEFRRNSAGTIAPIFALAMLPIMTAVGAAVDYSSANKIRSSMQVALDTAMLAGAKDGSSNWAQVALDVFSANVAKQASAGIAFATSFSQSQGSVYQGVVSASVPTSFLGVVHISSLHVGVTTTAIASEPDNSCILTLDHGQPASHVALTLNGAPIINLSAVRYVQTQHSIAMGTMAMRQNPLPVARSSGAEIQGRMLALFRIPTHR